MDINKSIVRELLLEGENLRIHMYNSTTNSSSKEKKRKRDYKERKCRVNGKKYEFKAVTRQDIETPTNR